MKYFPHNGTKYCFSVMGRQRNGSRCYGNISPSKKDYLVALNSTKVHNVTRNG